MKMGREKNHYKFKFNEIWNETYTQHLRKEEEKETQRHTLYIFFIQEVPLLSRICLLLLPLPPNSFLS